MKGKLPRLPQQFYRGLAYVFWTHTTENRQPLPLSQGFHANFRELLCHTCARYQLATPVYCLMPDHFHIFWIGQSPDSDQLCATKFFRKELTPHLGTSHWQRQAHDHVITSDERENGIYHDTIHYILQNPVRAGIVEDWRDYPYIGALIAGYPRLERTEPEFNEQFWKIYQYTIAS
jgi:REP element-mobilizing transposase RayT